jgi:glycine/D-amino acid oxidase-like deaminating enzyme
MQDERSNQDIDHILCTDFGEPPWTPPGPLPRRELPEQSEVVIVGAGVTGLSAAMTAAREGRQVTVVERRFGSGATSRSGGIVLGDTLVGPSSGFDDCDVVLRDWIMRSGAECELFWNGCLELARDSSLPDAPIDWEENGRVRLAKRVGGGVLDPAKLQAELARIALRAGATIVDGVSVLRLEPSGQFSGASPISEGAVVVTDRGSLRGDRVIMAVDAMSWRPSFDPWAERVVTVALTTEPLTDDALGAIGLGPHQSFYTRDLPLVWGRAMPDQSLLVGRETLAWAAVNLEKRRDGIEAAGERLALRVRSLHPALRDLAVRNVWGGPIARTAAGVPAIATDPSIRNVLWVGGYGGHGLAQAFRMGRLAVSTSQAPLRPD